MKFIATLDILKGVKEQLDGLKDTEGAKLFDNVNFYDATDIDLAFRDLTLYKQRVCLIVPAGDVHTNKVEGHVALMTRKTSILLLIADRDYTTGQQAVFGGPKNQGVIGMKDIVVNHLAGQSLGFFDFTLLPEEGDDLTISVDKKDTVGRKAWLQRLSCRAGDARVKF